MASARTFRWISTRAVPALSTAMLALSLAACSGKKPKTTPELSRLEGKKVALVEIQAESTARKAIEVALVNQLVQRGTFELVSKEAVEAARVAPSQDPTDLTGIARAAGADYALRARALVFDAVERSGYSREEIEDSQLKAETGESKATRLYKVKSLTGHVSIELKFIDTHTGETRSGIAESTEEVTAEAKESGAHLPPKLRFLEKLAGEAFRKFFDQYQD